MVNAIQDRPTGVSDGQGVQLWLLSNRFEWLTVDGDVVSAVPMDSHLWVRAEKLCHQPILMNHASDAVAPPEAEESRLVTGARWSRGFGCGRCRARWPPEHRPWFR